MQIIEISLFQAFRRSVAMVMQVVPKELRYVLIYPCQYLLHAKKPGHEDQVFMGPYSPKASYRSYL
ncbi:MAG: hypothetical protein V7K40_29910 [Nostoc sp.]